MSFHLIQNSRLVTCFLVCIVSEEKSVVLLIFVPRHAVSFSSQTAFKIYLFLSFIFSNLAMICLGVAYFVLIYLNLLSLSIYCFYHIQRILAIISLSIFFPLSLLLGLQLCVCGLYQLKLLHRSLRLCFCVVFF